MFANRLSWTYDFRGPSKAVDTGNDFKMAFMTLGLDYLLIEFCL